MRPRRGSGAARPRAACWRTSACPAACASSWIARSTRTRARTLLPEVGAYCAGLIDHLLRGEAAIKVEGGNATVTITGARGAIRTGQLRVFADDAAGARKQIGSWPASAVADGQWSASPSPRGRASWRRCCAAEDDAGVLVAAGEQSVQ